MDGVVDVSIALKLVLREPDSDAARQLLTDRDLVAPDILVFEAANGLLKADRARGLSLAEVQRRHGVVTGSVAALHSSSRLLQPALAIGAALNHQIYDCLYLALAEELDVPLFTADYTFLRKATAGGYGRVRPLVPAT